MADDLNHLKTPEVIERILGVVNEVLAACEPVHRDRLRKLIEDRLVTFPVEPNKDGTFDVVMYGHGPDFPDGPRVMLRILGEEVGITSEVAT